MTTLGLTEEQKLKVLLHQYNVYFTLSTCNSAVVISRFVYLIFHRVSILSGETTHPSLLLKRVSLPSAINPLFEEIHRDKKLLDIVCDLVSHPLYPISK